MLQSENNPDQTMPPENEPGRLRLVLPDVRYRESYVAMCRECRSFRGEDISGFTEMYARISDAELENFAENIVQPLLDTENGFLARNWRVEATQLWAIDDKGEFIGHVDIRHRLTEANRNNGGGTLGAFIRPSRRGQGYGSEMLRRGIKYAFEVLRLPEVMVCCHKRNAASRGMIIKASSFCRRRELSPAELPSGKIMQRFMLASDR